MLGVTLVLGALMAGPAGAASQTATLFDCATAGSELYRVTINPGDTFTIPSASCTRATLNSALAGTLTYGPAPAGTGANVPAGSPTTYPAGNSVRFTASAVGSAAVSLDMGTSGTREATWLITVAAPTPADPVDVEQVSELPPPVMQQFGKPASGTCDAAAPSALNWAHVSSGGWGESWSQWMNNGTGGFVCSRTLVYSNSLSAWTVA